MNTRTARKIERYARVNGLSFRRAASELASRAAKVRKFKARRKTEAEINEERFQKMKAGRPDLYQ